jgi:16S rRNA (guanine966-N2)-methyltransferase
MLRVVAGEAGGRRIEAPMGTTTRPTSDRVREAIFNALGSLDAVEGAQVLDAFAGSGALGIEAASRGAAAVTFADTDPTARAVISANLTATDLADRGTVTGVDGGQLVAKGPWDLVLLDPPYAFEGWPDLVERAADGLSPDGVVVIESDREVDLGTRLHAMRVRRYGGTVVLFASLTGETP